MLPPEIAVLDGELMPTGAAMLPVTDPGLLRGDSVFEVARVRRGKIFAAREHLDRMARSAANLRLPIDTDLVGADAAKLLEAAPDFDGCMRIVVTRGGHRIGLLEPLRDNSRPLTLQTISYAPSRVLDQVKSVSYAGNMLATRLAQEQGADEALLVSPEDRVLEGPTFSVFVRFPGCSFVTPPLEQFVLDSITRRFVLELMPEIGCETVGLSRLAEIEEAFIASTTRDVQPVAAIDGRPLPTIGGEATTSVQTAFLEFFEGQAGSA